MTDQLIPNVRPVDLDNAGPPGLSAHLQSQPATAARQPLTHSAAVAPAESGSKDFPEVKPDKKWSNPLVDVMLKFKVDAKTNEVSIMVVDRVTHKLVRTIPPEDMTKMDPGELLELLA